jgi:hypothetical protein
VKERLLAHITSAPSDLKLNTEPESSEDWLTEYAPLAQTGHDTWYFLCGVGTLVGGIVLRQLTSFLDPWRREPVEVKDMGILGRTSYYRPPNSWLVRRSGDRRAPLRWLRKLPLIWGLIPPLAVRADVSDSTSTVA